MKNKRLLTIFITIAILLLTPFISSFFTDEVNWNVFDYVIAAILLLTAGIILELIIRNIKQLKKRMIAVVVLVILFLLIWVELAVGIFDSPVAGS